jgi:hypothetical protein
MEETVKFARTYEQRLATPASSLQPRSTPRSFTRLGTSAPASLAQSTTSSPSVVNKSMTTLKLTPAEVAERRRKNQCFHCNDQYSYGHKEQCNQLFIIEVVVKEFTATPMEDDPTISLHALTRIQSRSGRTMQVSVTINGFSLTALLDVGSTHNCGYKSCRAGQTATLGTNGPPPHRQPGLLPGSSHSGRWRIILDDDYRLALGSYDMVPGVQWLESMGLIL